MTLKWSSKCVLCLLTFLPALWGHISTPSRAGSTVLRDKPAGRIAAQRTEGGYFVTHSHRRIPLTGELLRASRDSSALHHVH